MIAPKQFLARCTAWCSANAANLAATAAFLAIAAGFWMAWRPLGLIVPGAIVFAALAFTRLRGG